MANGALDSYLQVKLNNSDIANILLENGQLDNKIQNINLQNVKKNQNFQNVVMFAHKKKIAVNMERLQITENDYACNKSCKINLKGRSKCSYNFVRGLLSKKTCCKYGKFANLFILYHRSGIKLTVRESKFKGFVV